MTAKHGGNAVAKHRPQSTRTRHRVAPSKRPICIIAKCDTPVKDRAFICLDCTDKLALALGTIAQLVEDLAVSYTNRARFAQRYGSPNSETALSFDDQARTATEALGRTLIRWVQTASTARGLIDDSGPTCISCHHNTCKRIRAGRPAAPNALSHARWLLMNLQWLRRWEHVAELHDEITSQIRRALHSVDRPADRWYAGTCLAEISGGDTPAVCEAQLYGKPDDKEITCRMCHTVHGVDARRKWLLEYAEDIVATASEIARAVTRLGEPVTPSRIRKWKHRGRIITAACDVQSHDELYRVGDVLDLLRAHAAEQAARMTRALDDDTTTRHTRGVA